MDFEWVAIALGDVAWISLAFVLGFLARTVGLPPLIGFLATGFMLNAWGIVSSEMLQKLADLGITLLLFTVGLKLDLRTLTRPQVWAVTGIHTTLITLGFGLAIYGLAMTGLPMLSGLDLPKAMLIAFALSFSSTVFVVKVLEDRGEMKSLHGRIAVGVLIMQDLAAVVFLAASTGKLPLLWALLLFLLIPLRPVFHKILERTGHGELVVLYGLVLALGGAEIFELVDVKDDLGALIMGVLISSHPKSKEMAKAMLGFKDLFLVGFFLSIGMSGTLNQDAVLLGIFLVPLILIKSALFFKLMTRFCLRARTSLLSTLNLTNFSEFGLIVAAIGVDQGWLAPEWLVVIAIALSVSFVIAAPLNNHGDRFYARFKPFWLKFQGEKRIEGDRVINTLGATIAIFGMGRVGTGAYDKMQELHGDTVVGIDFDLRLVDYHREQGRQVLRGDPSDTDFWENVQQDHNIRLVMLALPNLNAHLGALTQLRAISYTGAVAATARYPDEEEKLLNAGATSVFNVYTEAGTGFANLVNEIPTVAELPQCR